MKALKNISILGLLLLGGLSAAAQGPTKAEAHKEYTQGDLSKARELIDAVYVQDKYAKDPEVWLIRGFIYKDVFKKIDKADPVARSRTTALESLYNAIQFDTEKKYVANSYQAFDYLTTTMFNDAARALNDMNDELAIALFDDYKKAELRLYPQKDLTAKEIEFKNALGTLYTKKVRQEKDLMWFKKATDVYEEVLMKDPDNYGANYNMATLYYNRGVQNIFTISPENDIPSIKEIQFVSKEFFILSMPYMLKAHELKPDRKETLIGLEGIYYSLQDHKKSEYYRGLYEQLLEKGQQGEDNNDK